jgi:antitoxin (DNA-binding transcriptional repressor) of toxin-antitoxin stability system
MDRYDISYAREHLDELVDRARRGEDVTIHDPRRGDMKLVPASQAARQRIVFGQWKHLPEIPEERLLAPLSEDEVSWLSGETSETEP